MTPFNDIFMISIEDRIDFKVLSEIFKVGCSRIPIFGKDRNDIVGLMLAKDLLFVDPDVWLYIYMCMVGIIYMQ